MQGVYLLGIVLTVFVLLWMVSIFRRREGFYSDAALSDRHNSFNLRQQKLYSNWGVALKAVNKEGALGPIGTDTTSMFGGVVDTIDENNNLKQKIVNPYPIPGGEIGEPANATMCETVKTADCSAFDNATFNSKCGLCLDIGKTSKNVNQVGGLLLSESDKQSAESLRPNGATDNKMPPYEPTLGTCPEGMFVANKAQCLRLQNQLNCAKNSTFDSPAGCSLCYTDASYSIVNTTTSGNPNLISGYGTLKLYGIGICRFKQSNTSFPSAYSILSTSSSTTIVLNEPESGNVVQIDFPKCIEKGNFSPTVTYNPGDVVRFNSSRYLMIEGAGSPGYAPDRVGDQLWTPLNFDINRIYIAGHIHDSGTEFTMDLYQLVKPDSITGRKPRIMGNFTKNGIDMTRMTLGFGQTLLSIRMSPTFTFVDQSSYESTLCKNSPFITKQQSATFLGSDPCYKLGQNRPGTYNMECLQKLFLDNGCLSEGKGYPSDSENASALLYNNGTPQSVSQIAEYIYQRSLLSSTGMIDGNRASITIWSQASEFCTGRKISSPCDADPAGGPFSTECLVYLWDNQGENSPNGATYLVPPTARSFFSTGKKNRFCTRSGLMSPKLPNGTENGNAINVFKNLGSVNAIKNAMNNIWSMANNNGLSEAARVQAMNNCYGLVPGTGPVTFTSNWVSTNDVSTYNEGFTGEARKCTNTSYAGIPPCREYTQVRPGEPYPACGDRVSVFGKPNFGEYNFSIPIGVYNTIDEIRRIPGNNRYTIYGHDGNVSFMFPAGCKLKLTINNGPNFSGPVTYVFTKSCPNGMITGSCGQNVWDSRWSPPNHFAQSIKLEVIQAMPAPGIPPPASISNPPKVFLKGSDFTGGNTWFDRSGNDKNAILKAGTAAKNSANTAIVLNGSTAWSIPNLNLGSGPWTASIWYKPMGTPIGSSAKVLLSQQDVGNGKNNIVIAHDWFRQPPGELLGGYFTPYNGGFFGKSVPLTNDVWTQIILTYDGSSVKTYVNKRLLSSTPSSTPSIDGGGEYVVGGHYQLQKSYVVGEIGELRIYNYSFSAAQVSDDYGWSGGPFASFAANLPERTGPGFNY
jgi:hypothetical protein